MVDELEFPIFSGRPGGLAKITNFPHEYPYGRAETPVVISTGTLAKEVIGSAVILEPGEHLLPPDLFAFITLPPEAGKKPGVSGEKEYIPSISRTGGVGPSIGTQILNEAHAIIEKFEETGVPWRWIDLGLTDESGPELKHLFESFHVDSSRGEMLRFLAWKSEDEKTDDLPKLVSKVE